MVNQAAVKSTGSPGQSSRGDGPPQAGTNADGNGSVVGSIAEFGNDVATLTELQVKLAAIDLKECIARATIPVAVAGTGLVILLGTVPVALAGVALLLDKLLRVGLGWTLLVTAVAAILMFGLMVFLSVREVTRSLEPLRRSHEELVRNLAWLRTVLVYSGRSYQTRRR